MSQNGQCKICRQKLSLGNQLRHQVICRPQNYESTSSSSEDDETGASSSKFNANHPLDNASDDTVDN